MSSKPSRFGPVQPGGSRSLGNLQATPTKKNRKAQQTNKRMAAAAAALDVFFKPPKRD